MAIDSKIQPATTDTNSTIFPVYSRLPVFDQRLIHIDISDINHTHDPVIAIDIHSNDPHLLAEYQDTRISLPEGSGTEIAAV
jgi:hypothetical protein